MRPPRGRGKELRAAGGFPRSLTIRAAAAGSVVGSRPRPRPARVRAARSPVSSGRVAGHNQARGRPLLMRWTVDVRHSHRCRLHFCGGRISTAVIAFLLGFLNPFRLRRAAGPGSSRARRAAAAAGDQAAAAASATGAPSLAFSALRRATSSAADLLGGLGVLEHPLAGVVPALGDALALPGVVATRTSRCTPASLPRSTISPGQFTPGAVHDLELGLAERRGDLVLDHLHPGLGADRHVAVLHHADLADVQPHAGVELQRVAARSWSRDFRTPRRSSAAAG